MHSIGKRRGADSDGPIGHRPLHPGGRYGDRRTEVYLPGVTPKNYHLAQANQAVLEVEVLYVRLRDGGTSRVKFFSKERSTDFIRGLFSERGDEKA